MITAQEAVDRVYKHFVVEGNEKSVTPDGNCRYVLGAKVCAFALCIPPEHRHRLKEGRSALNQIQQDEDFFRTLLDSSIRPKEGMDHPGYIFGRAGDLSDDTDWMGFWVQLQRCHDYSTSFGGGRPTGVEEVETFHQKVAYRLKMLCEAWDLVDPGIHAT